MIKVVIKYFKGVQNLVIVIKTQYLNVLKGIWNLKIVIKISDFKH